MSDNDFMSGSTTFTRNGSTAQIINEGTIRSKIGGYIALLAPEVRNNGIIIAKSGTVALASGEATSLQFDQNNKLINVYVSPSLINSLIINNKAVRADDGLIILSSQAMNDVMAGIIKNSNIDNAGTLKSTGGKIILSSSGAINNTGNINVSSKNLNPGIISFDANKVTLSGTVKANGTGQNSKGGRIQVTGDILDIKAGALLSATGTLGGGTILVGGDWQGSNNTRQATNVLVEGGATIDASAVKNGNGGKIVIWSDVNNSNSFTSFNGNIFSNPGFEGGQGGQVETSGHILSVNGNVNIGSNGKWLLDPAAVTIATSDSGYTNTSNTYTPNSTVNTVTVNASTITTALNSGTSITITTTNTGTAGTGADTITINSALAWTTNASLT